MKNTLIFAFFSLSLVLVSCNGYNRVVKSDNYDEKFQMANELYDKGEELRSVTLTSKFTSVFLSQVKERFRISELVRPTSLMKTM